MEAVPKQGFDVDGAPIHYSVGAVIERDGKYLLIDRANPPFGFAGVAGHVDEGEGSEIALPREVFEESGLVVKGFKLLYEELNQIGNITCSRGVAKHYWYLFSCEVEGDVVWNKEETKSIGWYLPEEIKKLPLEPVWDYWFKKKEE